MRYAMLVCVLGLFVAGPLAVAQPVADAEESSDLLALLIAIGLVVVIAVGSFMSSRRGHQD
ncbi:MAG: hypothetical protein AAFX76_11205 [Planctomycetota bacterium]